MRKKIHSESGESAVLALVIFLIISIISLVIVNAALTNAARLNSQKKNEQAYLAAQSIANMIADDVVDTHAASNGFISKYVCINYTGTSSVTASEVGFSNAIAYALGEACSLRQKKMLNLPDGTATIDEVVEKQVTLDASTTSGSLDDAILQQVNASKITVSLPQVAGESIALDDYYDAIITIEVPIDIEVAESEREYYTTRLHLSGAVDATSDNPLTQKTSGKTYVFWTNSSLSRKDK